MYKRSSQGWLKHWDFILLDVLALLASYLIAYFVRHGTGFNYHLTYYKTLGVILLVSDLLVSVLFNTMHNVLKRSVTAEFLQTFRQAGLVLAIVILYMFSVQLGELISRMTIYLTAGIHFALGFAVRMAWKAVIRKYNRGKKKDIILLFADEKDVSEIMRHANHQDGTEFAGLVLTNRDAAGENLEGLPVVADLKDAAEYICREWVDKVFVFR